MTRFQRGWHALTLAVATISVTGQLTSSIAQNFSVVSFFSYFTIQSNLLVAAAALCLTMGWGLESRWLRLVRLAGITGVSVTFLVYAALIGPHVVLEGADWWWDKGLHFAVPLLAVAGLFIGPRIPWQWADLAFIAWPAAWVAWTMGRAAATSPSYPMPDGSTAAVPYDFLDVSINGVLAVIITLLVIAAILLAIASVFITVSRRGVEAAV